MGTTYQFNPVRGCYEAIDGNRTGPVAAVAWRALALTGCIGLAIGWAYGVNREAPPEPRSQAQAQVDIADEPIIPAFGQLTLGAFASEAASMAGVGMQSTTAFANPKTYARYRSAVRHVYGADFADMNYLGIGLAHDASRIRAMGKWLLLAGRANPDVTIALEPLGPKGIDIFAENATMQALREVFEEASMEGITVWIRFASEANLKNSPYSASRSSRSSLKFFKKAVWFQSAMPENVRLIYSPLINTAVINDPAQRRAIELKFHGGWSQEPLPWSRIGGTLYRTNVALEPTFNRYYHWMNGLAPQLDFQLCELGGPYRRQGEIMTFLRKASDGQWPNLVHVNLFARSINSRADPAGQFGFVNPDQRAKAILRAKAQAGAVTIESLPRSYITKLFATK